MNLFQPKESSSSNKLKEIQAWIRKYLGVSQDVPISISQIQCHESHCPPIETVISIMDKPIQTYKIHCAVNDVEEDQIRSLA